MKWKRNVQDELGKLVSVAQCPHAVLQDGKEGTVYKGRRSCSYQLRLGNKETATWKLAMSSPSRQSIFGKPWESWIGMLPVWQLLGCCALSMLLTEPWGKVGGLIFLLVKASPYFYYYIENFRLTSSEVQLWERELCHDGCVKYSSLLIQRY